jgi:hypothetical protein
LRSKLLTNPTEAHIDPYMIGEIKRVKAEDVMFRRHHPE